MFMLFYDQYSIELLISSYDHSLIAHYSVYCTAASEVLVTHAHAHALAACDHDSTERSLFLITIII